MRITGISMPDELQMVRELPMDWISTMSYEKAQKWVKMHTPRKQMIYAQSRSSFLVLTTWGESVFTPSPRSSEKGTLRRNHMIFMIYSVILHDTC